MTRKTNIGTSSDSVDHPTPQELDSAIRILLGSPHRIPLQEQIERCRESFLDGSYDRDGLWVTRDASGRLNGAALVQAMPGALGVAWAPRGETAVIRDALARASGEWLQARGVKVGQAFAAVSEREDMAPLVRSGYERVTQLVFMKRPVLPDDPAQQSQAPPLVCSEWPAVVAPEQANLLFATHAGTRDCPELNDQRTPDEVVASFVAGNSRSCASWFSIIAGAVPVGVLALEEGPEPAILELSYLGLIPEARGRGHASTAVAFAGRLAASRRHHTLSLCVDARNEPALRLYRRNGFVENERRDVYLARWGRQTKI